MRSRRDNKRYIHSYSYFYGNEQLKMLRCWGGGGIGRRDAVIERAI